MLSTSELSTLSPFNAVAISLVYLYLVQSNPTHTIGLQLNHPCMHCNEVNVFRKLLVTSLGKSTLPIKKVGKCTMWVSAPGLRYGTSKPTNSCRAPIKGAMTPGGKKIWTLLLGWV